MSRGLQSPDFGKTIIFRAIAKNISNKDSSAALEKIGPCSMLVGKYNFG